MAERAFLSYGNGSYTLPDFCWEGMQASCNELVLGFTKKLEDPQFYRP